MNTLFLKSGNYTYKITYKQVGGLPKSGKITHKIPVIRPKSSVFYDKFDDTFKEIVYPEDLHHTEVFPNDPVEKYIHSIMEFMPEWQKIEICNDK
jgi:hypothetical protein